jgi:hypothetical protein
MNADIPASAVYTERPKGDIDRPPKVKKPTVKPKTSADMV